MNPTELSENSTDVVILKLQFTNASSSFSASGYALGTQNAEPWYIAGESAAYAIGGTLLFAFGFLALPHLDIKVNKAKLPFTSELLNLVLN